MRRSSSPTVSASFTSRRARAARRPPGPVAAVRRGRLRVRGLRARAWARRVRTPRAARRAGRLAQCSLESGSRRGRLLAAEAMTVSVNEAELLRAARDGDQGSFGRLVERYRTELRAHCYRMLGSVPDAEDALQETLLRAWRGLPRFEGRSSLRSWLYTIATNSCLRAIERRPDRVLPVDYGPPADPHDAPAEPLVESVWIEPLADVVLADLATPAARYEQREAVELAFIAALQHL